MSKPLIELKNVNKSFGTQKVLQNMNFHLNKGEIVGLLGPNGSGKTTLIRLMNGVIVPTSGTITIDGLDPFQHGNHIRAKSGTMTENAGLYEDMSGIDNLRFFAEIYGGDSRKRIDDLLKQFELTAHKDKKVGTYSTGMKKRLGLAKVLLHQPEILFLDEPTNGLDPEGIQMVLHFIKELNKQMGTTVLICSHILYQLESICDRYIFIDYKRLLEQGSLKEIEQKYLDEIKLKVETDISKTSLQSIKFPYERLSDHELLFTLDHKKHVPVFIQELVQKGNVYSADIINRDLETLYFKVRRSACHE